MSYAVVRSYEREREERRSLCGHWAHWTEGLGPTFPQIDIRHLHYWYYSTSTPSDYTQILHPVIHTTDTHFTGDSDWSNVNSFWGSAKCPDKVLMIKLSARGNVLIHAENYHKKSPLILGTLSSTIMSFIFWNFNKCRLQNKKYNKDKFQNNLSLDKLWLKRTQKNRFGNSEREKITVERWMFW